MFFPPVSPHEAHRRGRLMMSLAGGDAFLEVDAVNGVVADACSSNNCYGGQFALNMLCESHEF